MLEDAAPNGAGGSLAAKPTKISRRWRWQTPKPQNPVGSGKSRPSCLIPSSLFENE
jgi:hypothetical protein